VNRYLDWYEQGKLDLEKAKKDLESGYYEWYDYYNKNIAEEAIDAASEIIRFCENYILKQE
jgi:HEPN domain-containing protein